MLKRKKWLVLVMVLVISMLAACGKAGKNETVIIDENQGRK